MVCISKAYIPIGWALVENITKMGLEVNEIDPEKFVSALRYVR